MENNTNTETEGRLTLEEVAKILLVRDLRTIKDYAEKGLIPKIEVENNLLTVGAAELAQKLGVADFNETFIGAEDAQKMLGIKTQITESFCIKHSVPYFHLGIKNQRGRRLFFKSSLLIAWKQKNHITFESGIRWLEDLQKERLLRAFQLIFESLGKISNLSHKSRMVMELYFEGETINDIAEKLDASYTRIRTVVNKSIKRVQYLNHRITDWFLELEKEDQDFIQDPKNVFEELRRLREKNRGLEQELFEQKNPKPKEVIDSKDDEKPVLSMLVSEIDMSVRLYNCLKAYLPYYCNEKGFYSITLSDILALEERTFLRFRNFGNKSLNELREIVKGLGYELKSDLKKRD